VDLDALYSAHVAELGQRYGRVLEEHGLDAVVVHSGSPIRRSVFDDQFWPLRGCPHFQHWVALREPDCALLVRKGRRPLLARTTASSFWEKPAAPESEAFLEVLDVVSLRRPENVHDHLGSEHAGRIAFVGEDRAAAGAWGIPDERACPPSLVAALDGTRTTKTPYEVACIAEATRRARAGHEALREAFGAGDSSELDLHLLYLRATAQDDAETPYKNIVAIGPNAATLHHVAYGRHAQKRGAESLLVDAGACCRGYAADITRTWTKGTGAAASAFAHVVALMEALQQRLCAEIRVGIPFEDLHDRSHLEIGQALRDVGLVRCGAEEAVASGVTRAFYPHGLGHSLGLQTHDVGCALRPPRADNRFLRNTTEIAPGQVFTVEPGLYFIAPLLDELRGKPAGRDVDWKVVEALVPMGGVRIEDDIHVLDRDIRNVTREQLPVGGGTIE
jgi:Xaa-Pro dipeptidase